MFYVDVMRCFDVYDRNLPCDMLAFYINIFATLFTLFHFWCIYGLFVILLLMLENIVNCVSVFFMYWENKK